MKSSEKGMRLDLFTHQKLVRDYIQNNSPYRGILLFHGLGVGKTCASIGIAEGFRYLDNGDNNNREIYILLNKSLKQNFKVNLMKCGFDFYRLNNHWFYHTFTEGDTMLDYAKHIGIPQKLLKQNGAWFIDFTKSPNYTDLTARDQESLNIQIEELINKKYKFIHLDGMNEKKLVSMVENRILDNKLLIIDEVHNLTNAMSKTMPGIRGRLLKELIMDAENLKLVFLSGTPMINNLFETAQLFNLLRGYIKTYKFVIIPNTNNIPFDNVVKNLRSNPLIDQIIFKKSDNIVNIVRAPIGFISTEKGIENSELNSMDNNRFVELIKEELNKMNYNSSYTIIKNTALPDKETEFMSLFYNSAKNQIKNPLLFQSRIMGLVSYFRTQNKALLPTVTKNVVEEVVMSDHQFLNYSLVRKAEIDQGKKKGPSKLKKKSKSKDKSKGKPGSETDALFDDKKSSYRAYSRMHCSFVFPEKFPRPYPGDLGELDEIDDESKNDILDKQADTTIIDDIDLSDDKKLVIKRYEADKHKILKKLDKNKNTLFTMNDPEQLLKYSPKYNSILNKISKLNGSAFIYTEYKTLEGIAVLKIVLKANGYAEFKIGKNEKDELVQIFENEDDIDKPKFAFWGGNEEESDILRKVFNNEVNEIPISLKNDLESRGKNNLRGDVIKILLTTKTGAEGIDLHNVRQVHIVEPYWNPVRTQQVKGRAVRVGSHIKLPQKDRTVEICTYLSVISKKHLKEDKTIEIDSDGMTSDQVLFDISSKKLQVMTHLLKLIKEVSVDCSINIEETKDETDDFKCLSYGTDDSRENYSYIPTINRDQQDTEIRRKFKKVQWVPEFITINRKGKQIKYAIKKSTKSNIPDLLFDGAATISGQPGKPIGEITKKDGKTKFKLYK